MVWAATMIAIVFIAFELRCKTIAIPEIECYRNIKDYLKKMLVFQNQTYAFDVLEEVKELNYPFLNVVLPHI